MKLINLLFCQLKIWGVKDFLLKYSNEIFYNINDKRYCFISHINKIKPIINELLS